MKNYRALFHTQRVRDISHTVNTVGDGVVKVCFERTFTFWNNAFIQRCITALRWQWLALYFPEERYHSSPLFS